MKKQTNITKKIVGAAAAAMMCAAIPVLTSAAAQTLAGDVNKDGTVDVMDLISFTKYLHGINKYDQQAFENADMDGDGQADVFDLGLMKHAVVYGNTQTDPEPTTEPTTEPTSEPAESTGVVASIVFDGTNVTLADAEGNAVAAADASNVTVDGAYVTITKAGTYAISGKSDEGQIKVNTDNTAEPTALVEMSLEGLTLSNSTVAPIYVENVGDTAVISVKNKTENVISDGTTHTDSYTNSDGETKICAAAIYARDDLKIKGKGTLIVNGNAEDGIVCTNDLKIWNGTVTVNAVDDGIRADTVRIGDPDDAVSAGGKGYENLIVTVNTNNGSTGGDGIKASSSTEGKGYVTINGGIVNINSYADGIQADQTFTMNDGELSITTYQGSGYTGSTSTGSTNPWGGGMGGMGMDGNANKTDISAKGVKAVGLYDAAGTTWQSAGDIIVNGGTITVDSSDDSFHCGGSMSILGGTFTIATADDGFHSDHELTIGTQGAGTYDDVQINITKCYEGVEGVTINQNSGTVYIVSGDDGYNAAGGNDGSGSGNTNPWGGGFGGMSSSTGTLNINGGVVIVNSANGDHDAIDSNGDINLNGGYVYANGQEPLDCGDGGYSIKYNGGSVITMTAGNTNLTARYSFVDASGNAIASFLGASGNPGQNCTNCTAQSGGTVSAGTELFGGKVTLGGTLSGATQITASSSGSTQPGGPGRNW